MESLGTGIISKMSGELATLAEQRDPAEYTGPTGMIPFLYKMNDVLVKIGPGLKPLGPALQPLVDQSSTALARLDIGELLTQALGTVGADGVMRLQLDVIPPESEAPPVSTPTDDSAESGNRDRYKETERRFGEFGEDRFSCG